ncbi:MAG: hypothetical protein QN152_09085 [Armatimonadota bacterium]|nr:hypothetical protein [Armatimonadota bacterium]MDR7427289.1 hypothetical protein [Armatimonadota bacterium]MDR7463137.1 hypothetical protein [Armatimonadota bacterium]MDR7468876.1 hypothetical protein [Armatimonadota bacterium]MDR7474883.1 hypothetical protein [Armatimonadota bacterium]
MDSRRTALTAVLFLAAVSLLLAGLIIIAELRDDYALGGVALGAILVAYGLIVLFLRRLDLIGPRRAEGK